MPDTLFSELECPYVQKRFLWWRWQERTHKYVEVCRWSCPGHYSTLFYTKHFCTKCWSIDITCNEQGGP